MFFRTIIITFCLFVSLPSLAAQAPTESRSLQFDNPQLSNHLIDLAHPPAAFLEVNQHFQDVSVIRANFNQTKTVKVLHRPLISAGDFIFAKEKGVYWHLIKPIESEMIIDASGISARDPANPGAKQVFPKQPIVQSFADAMIALFAGEYQKLSLQFDVYFDSVKSNNTWSIALIPKDKNVRRFISYLIFEGSKTLSKITVAESSGDTNLVQFVNVRYNAGDLTDIEEQHFEH